MDMTHKSRTHAFKFLTPLTPSMEEIVNLHVFMEVYKPRNKNILIFDGDHNGMAGYLTGSDCVGF